LPLSQLSLPRDATGRGPPRELVAEVIVPLAPVEPSGAQAAFLESAGRSRMGTGRCARVSRSAPCRRARRDRRAAPAFPNPRLRLREVSKGRQSVEVVASHGTLLLLDSLSPPPPRLRRASCFAGRTNPAKCAARSRMVRAAGFEPATSWFQARSAAGLRYALKWTIQQDCDLPVRNRVLSSTELWMDMESAIRHQGSKSTR
jgi:hypothetical protein